MTILDVFMNMIIAFCNNMRVQAIKRC